MILEKQIYSKLAYKIETSYYKGVLVSLQKQSEGDRRERTIIQNIYFGHSGPHTVHNHTLQSSISASSSSSTSSIFIFFTACAASVLGPLGN